MPSRRRCACSCGSSRVEDSSGEAVAEAHVALPIYSVVWLLLAKNIMRRSNANAPGCGCRLPAAASGA